GEGSGQRVVELNLCTDEAEDGSRPGGLPEVPAPVLLARAAGDDKVAATLRVLCPPLDELLVDELVGRDNQEGIGAEILVLCDHLHGAPKVLERAVVLEDVAHRVPADILLVVVDVPSAVDAVEHGCAAGG